MEEAAAVRRAASEATADVEPAALRETIAECVADRSVVPGVLTLLSARQTSGGDEDLSELAAGVQLVYDGLSLTRDIAHDDPWSAAHSDTAPGRATAAAAATDRNGHDVPVTDATAGRADADMAIIAADVLVSRGFYILAKTDAASDAVGVVQSFGRDQTERETAHGARTVELDRNLEADVFELAIVIGVTATGGTVDDLTGLGTDYAPADPPFGPAETFFDEELRARLSRLTIDSGRPLNRND